MDKDPTRYRGPHPNEGDRHLERAFGPHCTYGDFTLGIQCYVFKPTEVHGIVSTPNGPTLRGYHGGRGNDYGQDWEYC